MAYVTSTAVRLENAYQAAAKEPLDIDIEQARLVFLSDLHRGRGDGADDFARCERNCSAALEHYYAEGYRLFVLGDAEELWEVAEEEWDSIYDTHRATFDIEQRFVNEQRYHRVFGNHDLAWVSQDTVNKYLTRWIGVQEVPEALQLRLTRGNAALGEFYLVHGHQGEFFSDGLRGVAEFVIRNIWRTIQNATKIRTTRWRNVTTLEGRDNDIYFDWAVTKQGVVSVMGHTHRMGFEEVGSSAFAKRVERILVKHQAYAQNVAQLDLKLHHQKMFEVWAERFSRALVPGSVQCFRPSFFNTGCGCFDEEQVTAIEVDGENMKMVAWNTEGEKTTRVEIAVAPISKVFELVSAPAADIDWRAVSLVAVE